MKKISSLLLTLLVSLSLVGISPSPASAAPPNIKTGMIMWEGTFGDHLGWLGFEITKPDGTDLNVGTDVTISISSCGNFVTQNQMVAVSDGSQNASAGLHYRKFQLAITDNGRGTVGGKPLYHKIGESATLTFTFSDPELDSVTWNMDTSKSHWTCAQINAPRLVKSWSVKTGAVRTAKIGKRVKATATQLTAAGVAAGARVSYRWRVGTKRVATTRYLRVKKAWRGRPLTMRIVVSAPGQTSMQKVIRYGTVRR